MRLLLLTMFIVLLGCQKEEVKEIESHKIVVAKIGDSELTSRSLKAAITPPHSEKKELEYLKKWVDKELLAQAAVDAGYADDSLFVVKIDNIRKDLLAMKFMDNYMKDVKSTKPKDSDLKRYFNSHRDQFIRSEQTLTYNHIEFKSSKTAWEVQKVISSSNFHHYMKKYSLIKYKGKQNNISKKSEIPSSVRNYLFKIKNNGISLPRKVGKRIHIYHVIKKLPANEQETFNEAYSKVKAQYNKYKQEQDLEKLLSKLRGGSKYYFNSNYFSIEKMPQGVN